MKLRYRLHIILPPSPSLSSSSSSSSSLSSSPRSRSSSSSSPTPSSRSTRLPLLLLTLLVLLHTLSCSVRADSSTGIGGPADSSSDDSWKNLICIVVIAVSSVLLVGVLYRIYSLHAEYSQSASSSSESSQNESDETTKRNWKIDPNDIEIGALIGQGSIGKVFKGKWRGLTVAVKEVQHTAKEDEVVQELSVLIRVRHPNLTLFMGLAMPSHDKLFLVSEHMARGNLYTVLHDKTQKLDWKRRITMALDAARALTYLHKCQPVILHKNLNSINLLVDKEFVTKVCDYALDTIRTSAKKSGVYTQPLWVAPELFKTKSKPTKASDVYSFGIILWEILTRKTPYQGMIKGGAANNIRALQDISAGMRPLIPDRCPLKYADLMKRCWASDPVQRPEFATIVEELTELEKEKSSVQEQHNLWLRQQVELDEIAIARSNNNETIDTLLSAENRKAWMVGSNEIKYEEVLGHGSFGEVWSGTFRGKKVAIKKLKQSAAEVLKGSALANNQRSAGAALKDFIKELHIMCSLRHPNVALFMGACLEEGQYAIIMEYCGKGSLYSIIHDISQPIDYNHILKVLQEVAEGVHYLHSAGLVHHDLKSLNILVDEDWNVKVSDFGLTDFKPDPSSSAADGGTAVGGALQSATPHWQSPESMERQEFSEASDSYSFGMVIWELFTREIPFQSLNPHQAALAVISEDKRPDIPNFVPPKFAALMKDCWLRDPKQRPTFPQILERLAILKKEGLPRIELSLDNAKLYRKKTMVFAFKSKDAVIVYKPWGTGESRCGDYVLVGPGDDVYTCDSAIFLKTYSLVDPNKPHLYRKTGSIFALEMQRDFLMETLEGMEHGSKGDWIAQNPVDGEQWPIAAKTFAAMYEIAPSQELPTPPKTKTKGGNDKTPLGALAEEKETNESEETKLIQRKKNH